MSAPLPPRFARLAAVVAVVLLLAAGAVWWWVANRQPAASPGGPGRSRATCRTTPASPTPAPTATCVPESSPSVTPSAPSATTTRRRPTANTRWADPLPPCGSSPARQPYDKAHNNPFEAFNSRFFVDREGDQVRHRRTAFDKDGRAVYDFSCEASYAIGSGMRGHSYLSEHDGFYFQTAISWYTQKQRWDVSPGFHDEVLAGRPVAGACFFCHVNHADPAEGTINHYPG